MTSPGAALKSPIPNVSSFSLNVEQAHIFHFEPRIGQTAQLGFGSRIPDAGLGEVISCEAAVRKCLGHQVEGVAAPASDVEHINARLQSLDRSRNQRTVVPIRDVATVTRLSSAII